nr:SDR family NAD(P)-dependent oxidoreductase [Tahibacter harae]
MCDDAGRVQVQLSGFTARVLAEPVMAAAPGTASAEAEVTLQQPQWVAAEAGCAAAVRGSDSAGVDSSASTAARRQVLIVGATAAQAAAVSAELGATACDVVALDGDAALDGAATEAFEALALAVFAAAQAAVRAREAVRLQVVLTGTAAPALALGVAGLLRTVQEEHAQVRGQVIEVASREPAEVAAALQDAAARDAVELRWADGAVQQRVLRDLPTTPALPAATPWKTGGVYLITGGAGGLGRLLAQEIAQRAEGVTLVLAGRSALDAAAQAALNAAIPAATVRYHAVDVGDAAAVQALVTAVIAEHGALHGVIHAAGVVKDSFVLKKTAAEWRQVLRPKVAGVEALDAATAPVDLDLFVVFSSLSALGNAGQADYAAANGYLDGFAQQRQQRVARGERWGRTVSVNWPYWADGGMRIDAATQTLLKDRHGSLALSTAQGWAALYQALASGAAQVLVRAAVKGWQGVAAQSARTNVNVTNAASGILSVSAPAATSAAASAPVSSEATRTASITDWTLGRLYDEVAALLKVSRSDLDADAEFSEYGFDSISLTALANRLNSEFGLSLMPTVFFEQPSLRSLAQHLARIDDGRWAQRWVAAPDTAAAAPAGTAADVASATASAPAGAAASPAAPARVEISPLPATATNPAARRRGRWLPGDAASAPAASAGPDALRAAGREPIAIVGMSGRFPQADDLAAFWQNLISGRDSIEEIPSSRWDWQAIYGDAQAQANRSQSKWGGFIAGVDEFDSLFFGISPREALLMDPQQRLLLQHAWAAIEDAGHAPGSLSGTATGVFIGTGSSGYSELVAQADLAIEGYSSTGVVPSVGPNRLSYFLNLHGPSEPIETACSSALVAVHRAVQAIRAGQCEQALVGGVNTLLTPTLHISFSKAGMLSEDGRCKTFSAQANGYVRGEGVGVLLLKRLSAAQADGDRIYAVIRGSAENHGGRANSLTAPNPRAQADLLRQAYRDAGIDVRTVGYIEAHGTGTPLGDPIEINALKSAFASLYLDSGSAAVESAHCALGSVKTNIGHLELAAGAAGLIKVLLQLQHGQLAPSLHCAEINPYIELDGTPFRLVREAQPWPVLHDARGQALPRRAGVSSFGFGGVNAHVVLEEYRDTRVAAAGGVTLLVLSARTPERLQAQAQQLLRELRSGRHDDAALADIAYTLQVGRDAMEERLGLIATSLAEAIGQLSAWCDHGEAAGVHHGQVKRNKDVLGILDEEIDAAVTAWAAKGKFGKVLELWVKGLPVRWSGLPGLARGRRISLPTYAFAPERHWVAVRGEHVLQTGRGAAGTQLHPLLHTNTSDLSEQRYTTQLRRDERVLADHVIGDHAVLPGAACLEMARAAVVLALGESDDAVVRLSDVVWLRPLLVESARNVHTAVQADDDGRLAFRLYTADAGGEALVHCQGYADIVADPAPAALAVTSLANACPTHWDAAHCYARYAAQGMHYGPAYRGVIRIQAGDAQALGRLELPAAAQRDGYRLHPSLLDAALQSLIALAGSESDRPLLPFALDSLCVWAASPAQSWVWLRAHPAHAGVQRFDLELCDDEGRIWASLRGFAARRLQQSLAQSGPGEAVVSLYRAQWNPLMQSAVPFAAAEADRVVLLCGAEAAQAQALQNLLGQARCQALPGEGGVAERFAGYAAMVLATLQGIVAAQPLRPVLLQVVVEENDPGGLGLGGLLKTARLENPRILGQLVAVPEKPSAAELLARLDDAAAASMLEEVRYA